MNSKSLTQYLMWIMWSERKRERGRNWVDSATYWVWFTSVLILVFVLLPHHCMHTWPWPLALNPTAGALSRHRHDRRGRKAELERGAWRRLMLALLSWQQQVGLEAPLPGAAPLAHHRFWSLSGEVKGLDRSPNNTGGASWWQSVRGCSSSGICGFNGLLEKTCRDPQIERWGNWGLRRVAKTQTSWAPNMYLVFSASFSLLVSLCPSPPPPDYVIWEDRKESWVRAGSQIDLGSNPCSVTYQVGGSLCYLSTQNG